MINLAVFCPFERVTSLVYSNIAEPAGVASFEIDFTPSKASWGSRHVAINELGPNRALGYSESDRLEFLNKREVKFKVRFKNQDALQTTPEYDGVVYNCLMTDAPRQKTFTYEGKDCVNGFSVGGDRCAYPEAAQYMLTEQQIRYDPLCQKGDDLRTFWSFIYYGLVNRKVIKILGPCVEDALPRTMSVTTLGKTFNVFDITAKVTMEAPASSDQKEVITQNIYFSPAIILRFNGAEIPFVFTQKPVSVDGRPLQYADVLKILYVAMYIELSKISQQFKLPKVPGYKEEQGILYVDVQDAGNYVRVGKDFDDFYFQYAADNQTINDVMENFAATRKSLIIQKGKAIAPVSSAESNSACFALCFANIMGSLAHATYLDEFMALDKCVDAGLLFINESGTLEGNTNSLIGNPKTFGLKSTKGVVNVTVQRKDITDIRDLKGVTGRAILGYDPKADNAAVGVPDHYVVVDVKGEHLELVYDPYMSGNSTFVGMDVTQYLTQPESCLITFDLTKSADSIIAQSNGGLALA